MCKIKRREGNNRKVTHLGFELLSVRFVSYVYTYLSAEPIGWASTIILNRFELAVGNKRFDRYMKKKQNPIVINKQSWSRTVVVGIEIFVFFCFFFHISVKLFFGFELSASNSYRFALLVTCIRIYPLSQLAWLQQLY